MVSPGIPGVNVGEAHRDGYEDANGNAGGDGIGGLLVVFRSEELGVLEGSVGWDQSARSSPFITDRKRGHTPDARQLDAAEDSIEVKVGNVEIFLEMLFGYRGVLE